MPLPKTLPQFLVSFARPHMLGLAGMTLVAGFWAANISLSPYVIKLIIDAVCETSPEMVWSAAAGPVLAYMAIGFGMVAVYRFYDWMVLRTFPKMKAEIVQGMFEDVEKHSSSYFHGNFSGSIATKIHDMAKSAVAVINILINQFLARSLSLCIGAFTLYLVNPLFSLVLVVWGVIFMTISILLSLKSQRYSEAFSAANNVVMGKVVDSLTNILNVKLFVQEAYESRYVNRYVDQARVSDQRMHWYLLKIKAFYGISVAILLSSMIGLLIYARSHNLVTVGDFALVLTLTMWLIDEVFYLSNQLVLFSEEVGICKQALSIVTAPHELLDRADAKPLRVTHGEVLFDNVSFRYPNGKKIFAEQSARIRPGEKVGLVGASGSGKSTFVNLLLRFFEADAGGISIDSQDIRSVTQHSLRSQISHIPQEPLLFHRTILENIRYGKLGASDEEVIKAARKAHCHAFIIGLPDGYHTMVGERGVTLSGGQRQRIAIARAILKNAPILILDEAMSSQDALTEKLIQESLNDLMKGKTTMIITHHLTTLFEMDRILHFRDGKILEEETF